MRVRFRIRHILIVSAVVALFMGVFAPELRSWDRNTRLFFTGLGLITALLLASFTPVWVVLRWFRKRSNRALMVGTAEYLILAGAYVSSIALFVGLLIVISVLVR